MIYLTAQAFPPRSGGIENLMGALAHHAELSGTSVCVYADGSKAEREYDQHIKPAYEVKRFGGLKPIRRRKKAKFLAGQVLQNPAPIYADSWKSLEHLPDGLNVPVIVFAHGNEYPRPDPKGNFPKQARIKSALSKATSMIAVSNDTHLRATPFIPKGLEVQCIHPPVEPPVTPSQGDASFAKVLWPKKKGLRCLVLCRLIAWKGVDMAIRAVAQTTTAQLIIAGTGDDRSRLEALVSDLDVADRVRFVGRIEGGAKAALFSSSDLFLQPGRKIGDQCEGFGITYVEAALHGLPSISGDAGGAPEAVIDGETALVVDATNLNNVTEALEKISSNANMHKTMSTNAKRHADAFLWPRQIDRILAVKGS